MDNNYISKRLFSSLNLKICKAGSFRILAKIHKNYFDTRPIINCISHPSTCLAILIDSLLQQFVRASDSFIQDSQNLLQKLDDNCFPPNSKLSKLDFTALNEITDFVKYKISSFSPHITNIIAFHSILELIFRHNIFKFSDSYYIQIKGEAMGSKYAPAIANIYLSILEKRFLSLYNPLGYYRYIEDIFTISENQDSEFIKDPIKYFETFGLTVIKNSSSPTVFLDLEISFDKLTNNLIFIVHFKKTNTFSYHFIIIIGVLLESRF